MARGGRNLPQYPAFVNPTLPEVPDATTRESEFGKPDETAVLDLTTEILEAELRAAQASRASEVPIVSSSVARCAEEMER
jgi:hypothetical protein